MADNPTTGSVQERHLTDSQQLESRIQKALSPESEDVQTEEPPHVEEESETEILAEAETEEQEATEEETEPKPEETSDFETIEDIAEALGLDTDAFLEKYKIKAKVDGEEFEASLKELKNGYQRDSDYRKKTMELSEHRKAFEKEAEVAKADLTERLTHASGLIDNLQTQLLGEFQSVNWNELRATQPGEYAALLQDFQSRQTQLNQVQAATKQESVRLQKEQEEKQQKQYAEIVQRERALLFDAIPEWRDSKVMESDAKQIVGYLKERGFNDQEIGLAVDHRVLKMAYDLMKSDKVKTKAETVKLKVKNLPKLVKPGSKQVQLTAKQSNVQKLKAKIKKTGGKTDDIAALLMERF